MKLKIAMLVLAVFCAAIPVVLVHTSATEANNISVEHRESEFATSPAVLGHPQSKNSPSPPELKSKPLRLPGQCYRCHTEGLQRELRR